MKTKVAGTVFRAPANKAGVVVYHTRNSQPLESESLAALINAQHADAVQSPAPESSGSALRHRATVGA